MNKLMKKFLAGKCIKHNFRCVASGATRMKTVKLRQGMTSIEAVTKVIKEHKVRCSACDKVTWLDYNPDAKKE